MGTSTTGLVRIVAVAVGLAALTACTVVRIADQESAGGQDGQYATWTKTGTDFNATEYVEAMWEERIIPIYEEQAVDYAALLQDLKMDRESAVSTYGLARQTGEPYHVFKVRGRAQVVEFDDTSRNGVITVDLIPADGVVDAILQVGPVIRGTAIRDSVEFIRFTDVGNQLQFADLANELNARMRRDSVEPLNLGEIAGTTIEFMGAFRLEQDQPIEEIVITPVRIDAVDGDEAQNG